MPELPEVETIVRQLKPLMVGLEIKEFVLQKKVLRRSNLTAASDFGFVGMVVTGVERIGKYIKFSFANSQKILIIHLGMSGVIRSGTTVIQTKSDVFCAKLGDNFNLVFSDPRGFGMLYACDTAWAENFFSKLAPDPFAKVWDNGEFENRLRQKRIAIKLLLLDQSFISGIGNIYACESLHLAQIHPSLPASQISTVRAKELLVAIRTVLSLGIATQGASFRDYKHIDGSLGKFAEVARVYGRRGLACLQNSCDGLITVELIGARSTYYCPKCQQFEEKTSILELFG